MAKKDTPPATPTAGNGANRDEPAEPRHYTLEDQRRLKAAVDAIELEQSELENQLAAVKARKSDAVFELQQALNGKPFRDAEGNLITFATKGETHYLVRKAAGTVPQL